MSDEMNSVQAPEAATAVATEAAPQKKQGFLSTTGGKVVAIVVGLSALVIVAGVAVAIVFLVFGDQAVDEVQNQVEQQVTETSQTTTGTVTAQAESPAPEIANSEIFTFRNIFVPLLEPIIVETATTSTTTTVDTVTATADDTLYLDGVVTQDGVLMAVLRYNGQTYTLAPGGVIPNSPWEVLRVSSTSVTMLYGENQVTLSVGQGITK